MKWFEANPIGIALAGISGFFLLLVLIMTIVWSLPVSVEIDETDNGSIIGSEQVVTAAKIAPLREYDIINQKPVFNETRLPILDDIDSESQDEVVDTAIVVADAPDVRLTGIIITPALKIASLTPADGKLEAVMAHEGESLTGEFLGWEVSKVNPRGVVLESRDGRTVQLELEVHDKKIQEPPKLVVPENKAVAQQAVTADAAQPEVAEGEEEPLSRAEQIRQRIAERREELRRQQEGQQQETRKRNSRASSANNTSAYQNAIRAKIRNEQKDESSDDNEDG